MEVHWFKSDHSQPIHLHRGSHEVIGEASPEYVNCTEFVKESIGDVKENFGIHNISIFDGGPYQCPFKDYGFSDVASMNLSVAGKCACGISYTNALVMQ
jgi:hypothetical protein